ncbi:Catabolic 3-dehydroquinase 2 [Fusarium torreyae]|uniref:Catabolic 3-dehydroquinase n=1 Tax=Fusarium torreyae TaxID=1237075 RepID=A0A9W8VH03_9HYPO|nr:Catabolic 3-dehydroquinase 2 [Fusarium torreyae]
MTRVILLINGPNLNLLGFREPHIYGSTTLQDVIASARAQAKELDVILQDFQSNHEGNIIDRIHEARRNVDVIIINPGAYTHTSVAIRDALLGVDIPFIEIHVTNPHTREPFRHHSFLCDKSTAIICGMGTHGYTAAVNFAASHLKIKEREIISEKVPIELKENGQSLKD